MATEPTFVAAAGQILMAVNMAACPAQ